MNKILVIDGIINSSSLVSIDHNNIIFNESGNYIIEYVNTRNVCISFYVENGANINLQEISFDNDIVGFSKAATLMPMIGSIPFAAYCFETENASD